MDTGMRDPEHPHRHAPRKPEGADHQYSLWSEEDIRSLPDVDVDQLLADGLVCRTPDGVADRMERISALGNGQVPAVAALAWEVLSGSFR